MADSGVRKKPTTCSHCSSASQEDVLCICSYGARLSPVSVVEMSETSSIACSDISISPERKKEQQIIKDNSSGKDGVNIKDSTSQHKLKSPSLMPSLASLISLMGSCQLILCLLTYYGSISFLHKG